MSWLPLLTRSPIGFGRRVQGPGDRLVRRSRLARLRGRVTRLERMRRGNQAEARRRDTREKIQLGGLIAKAGLRYEKRALLLGLLIDGAGRIRSDVAERRRLMTIGERAFSDEGE